MGVIDGTLGNDTLTGTAGDDIIHPYSGTDTIDGGAGFDIIELDFNGLPFSRADVVLSGTGQFSGTIANGTTTVISFTNIEAVNIHAAGSVYEVVFNGSMLNAGIQTSLDFSYGYGASLGQLTINLSSVSLSSSPTLGSIFSSVSGFSSYSVYLGPGNIGYSAADQNDLIVGGPGANILYSLGGYDTIYGMSGDDQLYGGDDGDRLAGGDGSDLIHGEAGNDLIYSQHDGAFETEHKIDTLHGDDGDDAVVGGGGDLLYGDAGVDTLYLSFSTNTSGIIADFTNAFSGNSAAESIFSDGTHVGGFEYYDVIVGSNYNDTLTMGNAAYKITGVSVGGYTGIGLGGGDDAFFGGDSDEIVRGDMGNDTMHGGNGNDSLTGWDGNDSLYGDGGDDYLGGGQGSDLLDGGAGNDTLDGGLGSDTFRFSSRQFGSENVVNFGTSATFDVPFYGVAGLDKIDLSGIGVSNFSILSNFFTEQSNQHIISMFYGSQQERITILSVEIVNLTSSSFVFSNDMVAVNRVGSQLNDVLLGTSQSDSLDGGAGDDWLVGGAGNDTYYVDSLSDQVTEKSGEGTDTVISSVTYSLSANVEHLIFSGGASVDGFGNLSANTIIGNAGDNALDGGLGSDTLDGGDGNDRIVYDAADNPANVSGGNGFDTLVVNGGAAPTSFGLLGHGFEAAERHTPDTSNQAWSEIIDIYNTGWQVSDRFIYNDDHTSTYIDLDEAGNQAFTQVVNARDAQGLTLNQTISWDDGTNTAVTFDALSNQAYTQVLNAQDTQGHTLNQQISWDDGTSTFVTYDALSNQTYDHIINFQNAQGQTANQQIFWDDGTNTFVLFDADGSQAYTQILNAQDSQNRTLNQQVSWDDGTKTFVTFDYDNSQNYTQITNFVDTQGRLDNQLINYDDGSKTFIDYDELNTQPWSQHIIEYATDGTTILRDYLV